LKTAHGRAAGSATGTTGATATDALAAEIDRHDPYRALRFRDYRLLLGGSVISSFGQQMLTVALGWELYNRTGSALALGGVGLALVLPLIVLSLPAGHIADRHNRKHIVVRAQVAAALSALGLAALSASHGPLFLLYGMLALMGGAQAFSGPASSALVAQVIPAAAYENAMTWRSSIGQIASVLGPAAGGFLTGLLHGATWVYVIDAVTALAFLALLLPTRPRAQTPGRTDTRTWRSLAEGLRFLRKTPELLAAITLDLFAVLLGGAVTLLPIYARDILHVGPIGLGWLQAAAAVGALCMALLLAHRPAFSKAGRALLLAVAAFGAATVVFGLSRSFALSLLMLFLLGACDNVSVVIRSTLVLVRTPDGMRGRVGAVNALFIGTSNQLGGFESGLTAQLFGPTVAVVMGGIGTILVVALVAWRWPQMRRLTTLSESKA
jgi:MFS family permease